MTAAEYRATAQKRRKYGNKPVEVDGLRFDSAKEARRYGFLKNLQMRGEIDNLECQVRFDLHTWAEGQQIKLCTYVADFQYRNARTGQTVVEDVKGPECNDTAIFKLKAKWMKAEHGIQIKIVRQA